MPPIRATAANHVATEWIDGSRLTVGTGHYDTADDRVLRITDVSHAGIRVDPATDDEVDGPTDTVRCDCLPVVRRPVRRTPVLTHDSRDEWMPGTI